MNRPDTIRGIPVVTSDALPEDVAVMTDREGRPTVWIPTEHSAERLTARLNWGLRCPVLSMSDAELAEWVSERRFETPGEFLRRRSIDRTIAAYSAQTAATILDLPLTRPT